MPRYSRDYGRGRPSGDTKLYVEPLLSIVKIAAKYDLDPDLLVDSFIEAWKNKTDHCGSLKITCRGVNKDETAATFLITCKEKVVSQFPIETEVFKNQDVFKNHLRQIPIQKIRKRYSKKDAGLPKKIGQLRYKMKKVDLTAKIIEIPPVKSVMTRFGNVAKVTNIKIADDSGSIRLNLWNQQIDDLNVGDKIKIENSYVARYAGELQLRLGRTGTIH